MSSFLGRYITYWVKLEGYGANTILIVDDSNPGISGSSGDPVSGSSVVGCPIEGSVELSFDTQKLHVINAE
jgi:hypothetical protein